MRLAFAILGRFAEAVLSLLVLACFTFFLLHLLPGSPFDQETHLNPEVRRTLMTQWGLMETPVHQLFTYFGNLLQGDLGISLVQDRPVLQMLWQGGAATFKISFYAVMMVFSLGFGIALMMQSRWKKLGILFDQLTVLMISLPSLFLGPLLIWIFAIRFDWLPVGLLNSPLSYLLPVLTLSLRPAAHVARILSQSLQGTLQLDYMRMAKAKGLSATQILVHHALKNSLLPLLGASAPLIMGLLSGSFLVEILFAIPGLGSLFVEALASRDVTLILGMTLFEGALLIFLSMLSDVATTVIDPRLRGRE